MQQPKSNAQLAQKFSEPIQKVRDYKQSSAAAPKSPYPDMPNVSLPNINPETFLKSDGSNGDIADLGICKLLFDFLLQLHRRFPKREKLTTVCNRFWDLAQTDLTMPGKLLHEMYKRCVERKQDCFHKHSDENEAIVIDELAKISYFRLCAIKTMLTSDLDMHSRKASWQHIDRIIKVVTIVSKFSAKSRKTLNRLADETLSEQERSSLTTGDFDIGKVLTGIEQRVLNNDEMLGTITNVAEEYKDEMKSQGMSEEQLNQQGAPF